MKPIIEIKTEFDAITNESFINEGKPPYFYIRTVYFLGLKLFATEKTLSE